MKPGLALTALAGLLLAVLLVAWQSFTAVAAALLTAGWGLVAIAVFHLVPLTFSGLAWQAAAHGAWRQPLRVFTGARALREAVAHLLPLGQIGAELVGARALTFYGAGAGVAGASVIVDLSMETVSQFVFTMAGIAILVTTHAAVAALPWLGAGLAVAALLLAAFFVAQRRGLFQRLERGLARLAVITGMPALAGVTDLHASLQTLYSHRYRVALGGVYHLCAWVIGVGETWLALYFMGAPVTWSEAFLLESLGQAIRSAAFAVPGALGVQEGGYILLVGIYHLSPATGLALSLSKRVRDALIGVPALLVWQLVESRRLWAQRTARAGTS